MKSNTILIVILLASLSLVAQKIDEGYVVYYFGATDCGYCNVPENIENVKKIKSELGLELSDENLRLNL